MKILPPPNCPPPQLSPQGVWTDPGGCKMDGGVTLVKESGDVCVGYLPQFSAGGLNKKSDRNAFMIHVTKRRSIFLESSVPCESLTLSLSPKQELSYVRRK